MFRIKCFLDLILSDFKGLQDYPAIGKLGYIIWQVSERPNLLTVCTADILFVACKYLAVKLHQNVYPFKLAKLPPAFALIFCNILLSL